MTTRHFGEIEIREEQIILFEEGIPGFEELRKFALISSDQPDSPFKWIQSMEKLELAFAIVNPFLVKRDYDFELEDEFVKKLDVLNASDVEVYSIVVVPEDTSKISMNLKAPIVINSRNRKAAQVILASDKYKVRHYILDEMKSQGV